jgi:hypothetical protein
MYSLGVFVSYERGPSIDACMTSHESAIYLIEIATSSRASVVR